MSTSTDQTFPNARFPSPAGPYSLATRAWVLGSVFIVMVLAVLSLMTPSAQGRDRTGLQDGQGISRHTPNVTALERVNAFVQPSVVYIDLNWTGWVYDTYNKSYLNDGEPITLGSRCTGFVVNPDGYIATAGHCVDPKEAEGDFISAAATWAVENGYYADPDLTVSDVVAFDDFRVEGADNKRRPDLHVRAAWSASAAGVEIGKALPARVITFQPLDKGDTALLKIQASGLNAIELQDEGEVRVGSEVVAVGYPGSVDAVTDADFSASYKDGSISSVKTVDGGLLPVYEISAPVSGGMSGGPTVDLQGRVIGINSFGVVGEQQPFNFVQPVQMLAEILAGAGVENEPSAIDRQYRQGLNAYFKGDRAAAIKSLRTVMREQPTHQLAQDYLSRARDLPVATPTTGDNEGSLPYGAFAAGIGGVLVLIVAAATLLRAKTGGASRRRPSPAASDVLASFPQQTAWPASAGDEHLVMVPVSANGSHADGTELSTGSVTVPSATAHSRHQDVSCLSCGTLNPGNSRFCNQCGTTTTS